MEDIKVLEAKAREIINYVPPKKRLKRKIFLASFLILLIGVSTFAFANYQKNLSGRSSAENLNPGIQTPTSAIPTQEPLPSPVIEGWEAYLWQTQNLSFQAPGDLNVLMLGGEGDKPLITIQNYPLSAPPPEDQFKVTIIPETDGKNIEKSKQNTSVDKKTLVFGKAILEKAFYEESIAKHSLLIETKEGFLICTLVKDNKENLLLTKTILKSFAFLNE